MWRRRRLKFIVRRRRRLKSIVSRKRVKETWRKVNVGPPPPPALPPAYRQNKTGLILPHYLHIRGNAPTWKPAQTPVKGSTWSLRLFKFNGSGFRV
jgi:hypothetical protein